MKDSAPFSFFDLGVLEKRSYNGADIDNDMTVTTLVASRQSYDENLI